MNTTDRSLEFIQAMSEVVTDLQKTPESNAASLYLAALMMANTELRERYAAGTLKGIVLYAPIQDPMKGLSILQELQRHPGVESFFTLDGDLRKNPYFAGAHVEREKRFHGLQVRFIRYEEGGALVKILSVNKEQKPPVVTRMPMEDPLPSDPAVRERIYQRELDGVRRAGDRRTLMDPGKRAYLRDLEEMLNRYYAPTKIDAAKLSHTKADESKAVDCEMLFYQKLFHELHSPVPPAACEITTPDRLYAWKEIAISYSQYHRQVTAFTFLGQPFLYIRFRRHVWTENGRPVFNDVEYWVSDGGSGYFEFCFDIKNKRFFCVYVHGEA